MTDNSLEVVLRELESNAGLDWNSNRSRVYIAAVISSHKKALAAAEETLRIEREVNRRVMQVLGGNRVPNCS